MNKLLTPKFIIFFIFALLTVFVYMFSSTFCDRKVNDFFTKVFTSVQNNKPSDDVVLVVIDDKSVNQVSWPWQRDLFSDIFDFLEKEAGAKSVVFQNLVVYPDTYYPESDEVFYKRLQSQEKLINSYLLLNSNIAGDVLPTDYIPLFEAKSNVYILDSRSQHYSSSYKGIIKLSRDFLTNVRFLASSIIPEDTDEVVRKYMPVVQFQGNLYPSLALSAYSMYMGIDSFVLRDDYLCSADDCKTLKMPISYEKSTDYIGNNFYGLLTNIKWYKPLNTYYSHKTYSAIDVLVSYYAIKDGKTPKISPQEFKDKIVIIGLNADKNVWEQLSETPILKKQADIDVHATMISNLLSNSFKTVGNNTHALLIMCLFSLFIIRGFKNFKNNLLFALSFSVIYLIFYIYQYFMNVYVPPITPIIIFFTVAILKNFFAVATTDKTSEMIKQAMGKYISKDVMKKVISNIDRLKPGGTRSVVTILFVDIRNFTQISEELSPQEVSSILNEYFSTISPVIAKYNGIVNKYMGDGLLAIFGEPIKSDEHSLNAIKCGIEITDKVKVLREKLLSEGKPKISIGIGINTGEVFAGNIGTDERLEYTVIGDNVNLAYRIEAYNQLLKTQFLISEYTYQFVKDKVEVVKLSQVSIKGKSRPIDIYEVLRIKNND
ncbi:MAG: adenylate/guanylate cyclase domain-containing protein [Candidatus Gastranaerophilales bacterium]|nr:adenylate/guanylate cyclase domain-containing protein [Candidatus Gastranaerophilales bacterium]